MNDERRVKPGDVVVLSNDIPASPDGRLEGVKAGVPGRVVRLVHTRVEGELLPDHGFLRREITIAHVRWSGASTEMPIDVALLRHAPDAPNEVEPSVIELVTSLRSSLSQRSKRFVVDALLRDLASPSA